MPLPGRGAQRAPSALRKISVRDPQLLLRARLDPQRMPRVGRRRVRIEHELVLLPQLLRELRVHLGKLALLLDDEVRRAGVAGDAGETPRLELAEAEVHPARQA